MSVVYAAFDLHDAQRPVALKVQRVAEAATSNRFLREAEILSGLQTPGIVPYVAHGQLEDGRVWLALEWLEGETLQQRLSRGPLDPDATLGLVERVCESLQILHDRGVVHRDIKPDNLFLRDGLAASVCLLDLGVARVMSPDHRMTRHGMVVGTPAYMAPEQARAAPDLDHRADLYAVGVVAFECLTGQQAWPGQNPLAVMVRLLVEPPPRLAAMRPDLGPRLDAFVSGLMSREPTERPATALDVSREAAALRRDLPALLAAGLPRDPGPLPINTALATDEIAIRTFLLVGGDPAQSTLADAASDRWQARLDALLADNGATVCSLADGSLLVTFDGDGVPTDHAARAARCALALAGHMPEAPLVVATGGMRRSGLALQSGSGLGRVIERAAEALRTTPPGRVRLDATTAGLLDARFVLTEPLPGELGERLLLGEIEPLSRARLVGGRPSPFVGRERELLLLEAWQREAARDRRARWVVVHGPAGQGKTRLRDELLGRFTANQPEMLVISGICPQRGGHAAGLVDALEDTFGFGAGEGSAARLARMRAWLERWLAPETLERAAPFVAELMRLTEPEDVPPVVLAARNAPEEMAAQVARAFADLLAGPLAAGPVVFLLDDAQWADAGTEAILSRALEVLSDQPLCVLTFRRGDPGRPANPRLRADLSLPPLPDAAADRLVAATLQATAAERARLVTRAAGNPFFLEELVRAAAEGRVDSLPETVLAMVQARLAGRSSLEKRVLRAASVFGLTFTRAAVQVLLPDLPRDVLADVLHGLHQAELIDDEAWQPAGASVRQGLRFSQEAVREAAYAMLTPEDRIQGHARAAEWLATQAPAERWRIAEHLVSAERPADAAQYFVEAAELSLEHNDLNGAAALAARGLAVCGDDPDADAHVGAMHQILAHVAGWRGQRGELAVHAERALVRLPVGSVHWFRAISDWITIQTSFDDVRTLARLDSLAMAARQVMRTEVKGAAAMCLCRVATRTSEAGATQSNEALFQAAFDLGRDPALPPPAGAVVQRTIAVRAWRRGEIHIARAALRRALYEFESYGFERQAAAVRGNLGVACNELGLYAEALELLDETVREAARLGLVRVEAAAWHNLGHTLFRVSRFQEAEDAELTALRHFESQGDTLMAGAARCYLARIHTHQGRPAQGEAEARRAALALHGVAAPLHVLAQAALAEALLAQGRAEAACDAAVAGGSVAETLQALGEGGVLLNVVWAEALDALGDRFGAMERFAVAQSRVLARAAEIPDEDTRRAWCENVAENAQALARCEELELEA